MSSGYVRLRGSEGADLLWEGLTVSETSSGTTSHPHSSRARPYLSLRVSVPPSPRPNLQRCVYHEAGKVKLWCPPFCEEKLWQRIHLSYVLAKFVSQVFKLR